MKQIRKKDNESFVALMLRAVNKANENQEPVKLVYFGYEVQIPKGTNPLAVLKHYAKFSKMPTIPKNWLLDLLEGLKNVVALPDEDLASLTFRVYKEVCLGRSIRKFHFGRYVEIMWPGVNVFHYYYCLCEKFGISAEERKVGLECLKLLFEHSDFGDSTEMWISAQEKINQKKSVGVTAS